MRSFENAPIQKICGNNMGNIFLLYGEHGELNTLNRWNICDGKSPINMAEIKCLAEDCNKERTVFYACVNNMAIDGNNKLYFVIGNEIRTLDTSVREQTSIYSTYVGSELCLDKIVVDETGLYCCWNNNIEKFYFYNVCWKKGN